MAVSVVLPDPTPVTTAATGLVGTAGVVGLLEDPQPVTTPRVGALVTFNTPVPGFAIQASAPRVVLQATVAGRAFVNEGGHSDVHRVKSYEGQAVAVKARPVIPDQSKVLLRADILAATWLLFDDSRAAKATPVHQEELAVSSVMQAALVDDASWQVDPTGYSFFYTIPGHLLREGGHVYRAEFILKTHLYGPVAFVQEIETIGLRAGQAYLSP
ncbi:MAG: hypothetical protein CMH55_07795 [Myxococcales bacterium]|nr:hypothetical protein [Myxococcales bacterium]